MKLCKHLEPIYQSEIKRGNSIVYLSRWGEYFIVYLKNKMSDYSLPNVKFSIEKDHHFPYAQDYICVQCHCSVSGPLETNQKDQYRRDNFTLFTENAVATPDTIEIKDELWETLNRTIVPKFVDMEDKY